jgi:hypothetical protein
MSEVKTNGAALYAEITMNETKPDWGSFPPRRLRKANTIWQHLKTSGRGISTDGMSHGKWFTAEMIYTWYNENYRYDITVNWLANILARNSGAFVRGPELRVNGTGLRYNSGKVVALWRAI